TMNRPFALVPFVFLVFLGSLMDTAIADPIHSHCATVPYTSKASTEVPSEPFFILDSLSLTFTNVPFILNMSPAAAIGNCSYETSDITTVLLTLHFNRSNDNPLLSTFQGFATPDDDNAIVTSPALSE